VQPSCTRLSPLPHAPSSLLSWRADGAGRPPRPPSLPGSSEGAAMEAELARQGAAAMEAATSALESLTAAAVYQSVEPHPQGPDANCDMAVKVAADRSLLYGVNCFTEGEEEK
ncbi:unnamed protein product, partial [Urochloa humidicola]